MKYAFFFLSAVLLAACAPTDTPVDTPALPPSQIDEPSDLPEADAPPTQDAPMEATQPTADPAILATEYTLAEVQAHASKESCYTVVAGGVYDITAYIPHHPGGERDIMKVCGTDGSALFTRKHGANDEAQAQLASMQIGVLANQ